MRANIAGPKDKVWQLSLANTRGLTDATLAARLDKCPNLISLGLGDCRQLTDAAITTLRAQRPALTVAGLRVKRAG